MKRNAIDKIDLAMIIGLLLAMLLTPMMAFGVECGELQEEVFRLHILANSDTEEDQTLKLKVRDAILAQSGDIFGTASTIVEAEQLAQIQIETIVAIAEETLVENGSDYKVQAEIANMYFDTRVYDGFTMPAGRYDALRITIGTGQGKNWWCVMFPPMCVEAAVKEPTPLTDKIENLGNRPNYEMAFASVELLESIVEWFGGQEQPLAMEGE